MMTTNRPETIDLNEGMEPTMNSEFRTCDLYFASYLKSTGVPLCSTSREGGKVYFIFGVGGQDTDALMNSYFSGMGTVSALAFSDALKSLKALVAHVR